ncbi:hypothetical protein VIGAN_06181500 [Vigna angularis var. angularis]|uniref:Secreted protein n=1 Tax=Vigna angularis var. angularis TaxID=157739 RepID=A0A0S3SCE8_PHAAN|nr:hypothetical protein VIGAN_06181500 [Vigna angularis var. angularis]
MAGYTVIFFLCCRAVAATSCNRELILQTVRTLLQSHLGRVDHGREVCKCCQRFLLCFQLQQGRDMLLQGCGFPFKLKTMCSSLSSITTSMPCFLFILLLEGNSLL